MTRTPGKELAMAEPSVFHPRTSELCISNNWKEWGGYYAVCSYDVSYEGEYFAIRHSAGFSLSNSRRT